MTVVDVVCGMEVEIPSEINSEYKGHLYYFCGTGCKGSFDNAPWKMATPVRRVEAVITRREDVSPRLFILWINPVEPMTFKPGHYIVAVHPEVKHTNPYTIVSAPHEQDFELYVELVPNGDYTPILHRMGVGEVVHVRHTNGRFVLDPDQRDHVMVAERHTIAPYVSMLRDHLREGRTGSRFHIVYGDAFQDELAYRTELATMANHHPDTIRFVPVISQPEDPRNRSWSGHVGDVHDVAEQYLRSSGLDPSTTLVYECGYDKRIDELRERVSVLGYPFLGETWWRDKGHGSAH